MWFLRFSAFLGAEKSYFPMSDQKKTTDSLLVLTEYLKTLRGFFLIRHREIWFFMPKIWQENAPPSPLALSKGRDCSKKSYFGPNSRNFQFFAEIFSLNFCALPLATFQTISSYFTPPEKKVFWTQPGFLVLECPSAVLVWLVLSVTGGSTGVMDVLFDPGVVLSDLSVQCLLVVLLVDDGQWLNHS